MNFAFTEEQEQLRREVRDFLEADFPHLFSSLSSLWAVHEPLPSTLPWQSEEDLADTIRNWITTETVSALGVLASSFRWGDESRVGRALEKLAAISDLVLDGSDTYSWLLAKLCGTVAQT